MNTTTGANDDRVGEVGGGGPDNGDGHNLTTINPKLGPNDDRVGRGGGGGTDSAGGQAHPRNPRP